MEKKDELVYSIITRIADQTDMPVRELKQTLEEELYDYNVTEITDTQLATTDGSTTEALLNYFINGKRSVNNSEAGIINMVNVAKSLVDYVGKELPLIQPDEIRDYISYMQNTGKWTDATADTKRLYLSSVFTYLHNHGQIISNPMLQVDPIKYVKKYKTPLTGYEIEKIKMACENEEPAKRRRDLLLIMLLYDTGCRCSELANIKMADVDIINRTIVITKSKNKKQRLVCYSEATQARLEEYFTKDRDDIEINGLGIKFPQNAPLVGSIKGDHHKLSKNAIEEIIKGLRERSGVGRVTPHYFRSACVLKLHKAHTPDPIISMYVGHEKRESLKNYLLVSPDEVQKRIAQVI